jgi:putative membrane protein
MFTLERAQASRRVGWTSMLGLILVPMLVAGGFLWATWNSSTRLDRVQAAIVNNDEGVTLDKQFVPLGRQLAGGLVKGEDGSDNFDWVLTDDADAKTGLEAGTYAAVVTIPEDFSKQATSFSSDETSEIAPATIDVQTSQIRGIADGVVAEFITAAATSAMNTELTKQYLDNIYIGFNDTGKQFQTVADAAQKVSDGTSDLADGIEQTSDGTGKLADGLSQLDTGMARYATGVGTYADGVGTFSDGVSKLSDGTASAAAGAKKLSAGGSKLDDGADELVKGAKGVVSALQLVRDGGKAGSVDVAGTKAVAADAIDVAKGVGTVAGTMGAVAAGQLPPDQVGLACPDTFTADQCVAWNAAVQTTAGSAAQQLKEPATNAGKLAASAGVTNGVLNAAIEGTKTTPGLKDFPAGVQKFATGLDTYTDGVSSLSTGIGKLATGTDRLATGATQLADGADQLDSGASQLAAGVHQSAIGTDKLAAGVVKLSDGGGQLADGTEKLADGLAKGAKAVPTFDKAKRTALSTVVANPVSQERPSALFADIANTTFLSIVALWLGGLASFLILRAVPSRVLTSSKPSWRLAAESVLPAAGIGVVQAVALTISLQMLLDLTMRQTFEMLPLLVLTALAFVAINHALVAWLGGVGRFISVAVVVLVAAAAITDAVPAGLSAIVPFLPLTPALEGARAIASGGTGALGAGGLLFIWLVAGVAAGVLAVSRRRLAPAPVAAWAGS